MLTLKTFDSFQYLSNTSLLDRFVGESGATLLRYRIVTGDNLCPESFPNAAPKAFGLALPGRNPPCCSSIDASARPLLTPAEMIPILFVARTSASVPANPSEVAT